MMTPEEFPNWIALFTLVLILLLFEVRPPCISLDLTIFNLRGVESFLFKAESVTDKICSLSASTPASPVANGALSHSAFSFHQKHESF